MQTIDIQKDFFNTIINSNSIENKNKQIYQELISYRFEEVIKSTYPIYCDYMRDDMLILQINEFIVYGCKTSYVWQVAFEFKRFLFEQKQLSKIQKQILIFEEKQIRIYGSSKSIKIKKISQKRFYRLSPDVFIQKHNFDIVEQTYKKTKEMYYLTYKDINNHDVYYIELSKFLYYFLKYQRGNNTLNKAIYFASKKSKINYNDAKNLSLSVINNFINTAVLI